MDAAQMADARRQLVQAMAVLGMAAARHPSLEARNLIYHSEKLAEALDAFYGGQRSSEAAEGL